MGCEIISRGRNNLTGEDWGIFDMKSTFTRANVSRLPTVFAQAFLRMQTNQVFAKLSALNFESQSILSGVNYRIRLKIGKVPYINYNFSGICPIPNQVGFTISENVSLGCYLKL